MRCELEGNRTAGGLRKFLLDLGKMAVFRNGVWTDAFVALDKEVIHFRLAARPADAAERIGDHACGLNEACLQQGNYREQNAGWIATRGGDECGVLNLGAIDFW